MKSVMLLLLIIIRSNFAAAQSDKHTLPLTVENHRSHVTVTLDELTIPRILLDSGFAFDGLMIYNPAYLDSLDLSRAVSVQIGGAGSGEASRALMINDAAFDLGGVELMNQRLLILQGDTYKGFHSNGIIGYSLFGHYVTEFNYDKDLIILHNPATFQSDSGLATVPLYFKQNQIPWVDVQISIKGEDPVTVSAYIDFAAAEAVLLLKKQNMKFTLPEKREKVYIGRGLSGDIYGEKGKIASLKIGPFELQHVEAMIADAAVRSKQADADVIIGHKALSKFNFILDYENRKLYIRTGNL